MEITGLKRDHLLKTGQKASFLMFAGTTGHDDQKGDNHFLNWTYDGHPNIPLLIKIFEYLMIQTKMAA